MDGSNFMLGRPKTMGNYDIYQLFGCQQFKNRENSETIEEFNEEDIWGGATDAEDKQAAFRENGCNSVKEWIVGNDGNRKINKFHGENHSLRGNQFSSAPVKIPDCPKMVWLEGNNIENFWTKTHEMVPDNDNGDDEVGDFEGNMIPPHELIALQLGPSEIASFSEFEGVGKTQKKKCYLDDDRFY